mmetsp:Transcript_10484/g.35031  ORF Transcript_10484/g.35031 Transcript_10484/m.35031 type:complete len:210 (-) Transcript_10484:518-1147(-)
MKERGVVVEQTQRTRGASSSHAVQVVVSRGQKMLEKALSFNPPPLLGIVWVQDHDCRLLLVASQALLPLRDLQVASHARDLLLRHLRLGSISGDSREDGSQPGVSAGVNLVQQMSSCLLELLLALQLGLSLVLLPPPVPQLLEQLGAVGDSLAPPHVGLRDNRVYSSSFIFLVRAGVMECEVVRLMLHCAQLMQDRVEAKEPPQQQTIS